MSYQKQSRSMSSMSDPPAVAPPAIDPSWIKKHLRSLLAIAAVLVAIGTLALIYCLSKTDRGLVTATAFGGIAMTAAAIVAGGAWYTQWQANKEQVAANNAQMESMRRRASVERLDLAIRELTTGDVAKARDVVATWQEGYCPKGVPVAVQHAPLVGPNADYETRRELFVLLWALHRQAPLVGYLKKATRLQRKVLLRHLSLIATVLVRTQPLYDEKEADAIRSSWQLAVDSLTLISKRLLTDNDDNSKFTESWDALLSQFDRTLEKVGATAA